MALLDDTAPLAMRALVRRVDAIRENELQRLFARCPKLSEWERASVQSMSQALVQHVLYDAIAKISEKTAVDRAQAAQHARVLIDLFGADAPESEDVPDEARSTA